MVGMATILYGMMWLWFARENRRRDAGHKNPDHESLSEQELSELGDESHLYRYTI
jgi:hypothetical protein